MFFLLFIQLYKKISKLIQFSLQFTFFKTSKVDDVKNFLLNFFVQLHFLAPLNSTLITLVNICIYFICIMSHIAILTLIVKYILNVFLTYLPKKALSTWCLFSCSIDFCNFFLQPFWIISNQSIQNKLMKNVRIFSCTHFNKFFLGENYYIFFLLIYRIYLF